jgi:hypothetical protein
MGALYLATAGLLGLVAVAARAVDKPLGYFTREPVEAVSQAGELCSGAECSYAGFVSNVGILIGCAAAVSCFLVAYILRTRYDAAGGSVRFLLAGGALTTLLLADDIFMLHEYVVPELVGGGEKVFLAAYLAAGSAFLLVYRAQLLRTDLILFAAAIALFATSVAADKLLDHVHLVEDGAKLLGLVTWTAYFAFTALDLLARGDGKAV